MDNNVEQAAAKSQTADSTTAGALGGPGAGTPSANSSTFWKNSGRRVPGRPSPKRELEKSVGAGVAGGRGAAPGTGMVSTFTEYQKSVSDAWDMGDDEFCIISSTEAAAAAAAGAGGGNGSTTRMTSLYSHCWFAPPQIQLAFPGKCPRRWRST